MLLFGLVLRLIMFWLFALFWLCAVGRLILACECLVWVDYWLVVLYCCWYCDLGLLGNVVVLLLCFLLFVFPG